MAEPDKRPAESMTEMVQVVLPNDANPLGFILGGTVMHLIDIAGAIAAHRHARCVLVTAAVDGLQFLHPIRVGDLIILKAHLGAVWFGKGGVARLFARQRVVAQEVEDDEP